MLKESSWLMVLRWVGEACLPSVSWLQNTSHTHKLPILETDAVAGSVALNWLHHIWLAKFRAKFKLWFWMNFFSFSLSLSLSFFSLFLYLSPFSLSLLSLPFIFSFFLSLSFFFSLFSLSIYLLSFSSLFLFSLSRSFFPQSFSLSLLPLCVECSPSSRLLLGLQAVLCLAYEGGLAHTALVSWPGILGARLFPFFNEELGNSWSSATNAPVGDTDLTHTHTHTTIPAYFSLSSRRIRVSGCSLCFWEYLEDPSLASRNTPTIDSVHTRLYPSTCHFSLLFSRVTFLNVLKPSRLSWH